LKSETRKYIYNTGKQHIMSCRT